MVYLKRTFHPVGQGAFFTEQFLDDTMRTVLYNVVYDCGSKSRYIKTQMKSEIRNCFHDKKGIDVLFLSHFDDDHINYVKYLQDNGYLQGTKIFIPMLAAEGWLGIKPYATNYKYVLALNSLAPGSAKVIRVNFDDLEEGDLLNRQEPLTIEEIQGNIISSGITLQPSRSALQGFIWCYTPFNIQFKTLITDFKDKLYSVGLDYDKLKEDKDYVLAHKDELKKIYQGLGKKPSGGTAINLNSLLVMSYPENEDNCNCIRGWFLPNHYERFFYRVRSGYYGSCLYTGDTSANEPFVWNRIENMICQCLGRESKLTLMQVPHHGSQHSYDQKLLASNKFHNGFANFDPYYRQHIFDDNLPMKFAANNKTLFLVTRDYCSRFEVLYKLV